MYVQNVHHLREHMHSNDYATAQSLMVSATVSSLGATQLHFLEPGVKVNGDYYRNTVLLNMLLLDIRSVFGEYYVFQQDGGTSTSCTWHCQHGAERDARVYPSRDVATYFARFESGGLQHLGYASREGLPLVYPWCELKERWKLKERLLREWRLPTMHTVIPAAIAQWHSRLNACVRVNGGHFEHKFWASDFLLCSVCFVDTGFCKCDRYKHVQCATIVWNVLLLCLRISHGMVAT